MKYKRGKLIGVDSFVENIKSKYNLRGKDKEFQALRQWPAIVGERLSAYTKPLYIVKGVLYVETQGPVWSQEISFRKNEIIENINEILNSEVVLDIRYKSV